VWDFGPHGIPLHAEWSGLENIGTAAVMKSVYDDFYRVVIKIRAPQTRCILPGSSKQTNTA
jgi:hypothetical protein